MTGKLIDGHRIPRYVNAVQRRGRWYFYYRHDGPPVRLYGKLGSKQFEREYLAARGGMPLPPPEPKPKPPVRKLKGPKQAGVYLLFQEGELVYIGASLDLSQRVIDHDANGRPFDRAYFIATSPSERFAVEKALIKALHPPQNRSGSRRSSEPRFQNGNDVLKLGQLRD